MVCHGISGVVNSRLPMKKMKPMLQKTRESFCMEGYRVFSHDVTAAILVSQDNETAAMLVSQTNPVGV